MHPPAANTLQPPFLLLRLIFRWMGFPVGISTFLGFRPWTVMVRAMTRPWNGQSGHGPDHGRVMAGLWPGHARSMDGPWTVHIRVMN